VKPVRVSLRDRSYEIRFGSLKSGLGSALNRRKVKNPVALIVSSQAVSRAGHVANLERTLRKVGFIPQSAIIPDGESFKTLDTIEKLYRLGFKYGLDRTSLVLAMGGGVVTDLAGFFAATYLRGISYVSIPSTLLGMVDAAIGGKTGVDRPEGKNLVGAFWQPRLVWIDLTLLKTLPRREWNTGFAEIIKYGVIKDEKFFSWLERKIGENPRFEKWKWVDVETAVGRSVKIKAGVVSGDERETPLAGGREILNFGHTVGHALEASYRFAKLSHGKAISIGMNVAGLISLHLGLWNESEHNRLIRLLTASGLPVRFPRLTSIQSRVFWEALLKDKKNVDNQLRFVLPRKIGRVEVRSGIPLGLLRKVLR
jgi:3-dehydroquinate synthase